MDDASSERRLFLESVSCDYFRFLHLDAGVPAEDVMIRQEVALGSGAFADIEVRASGTPPYFVEIDTGYSQARLLESVRRKYGKPSPATDGASRVVIVADEDALRDRPDVEVITRRNYWAPKTTTADPPPPPPPPDVAALAGILPLS